MPRIVRLVGLNHSQLEPCASTSDPFGAFDSRESNLLAIRSQR